MTSPKYLVDTNVILARTNHRQYDELVFPIYWENFDKLVEKGTIISLISIKEEIESVVNRQEADDGILNWVEDHSQMFRFPPDERYAAETIFVKNKLQGWYRKNENNADTNIVVFAKAYNLTLVTQETPNFSVKKQGRYKIPTACKELGAYCRCGLLEVTHDVNPIETSFQCINFVELVRREKLNQE
ncbi:MAG: DUF4411 family protein [Methanobrevibacter sp.]|nr:DUF4411 family protein [Methanobrevibacter sp.]